jgi:hypothetical protein
MDSVWGLRALSCGTSTVLAPEVTSAHLAGESFTRRCAGVPPPDGVSPTPPPPQQSTVESTSRVVNRESHPDSGPFRAVVRFRCVDVESLGDDGPELAIDGERCLRKGRQIGGP